MDDASGVLDIYGGCESTANLLGGANIFCEFDLSEHDAVNQLPRGILGKMVCPKMCHGCSPAADGSSYITPYDYDNVTACYNVNCTILNSTAKFVQERDGVLFSEITSLRKVTLSNNNLTHLGDMFKRQVDLLDLVLRINRLSWFPTSELSSQINLIEIDLSYNLIENISTSALSSWPKLRILYLTHNKIRYIEKFAFAASISELFGTLTMLNIANQDLDEKDFITLEEYAFAACCEDDPTDRPHDSPLILSMNRIPVLPANTFAGYHQNYIDLNHIGVEKVLPFAFNGSTDLNIDLRGNNIREMSSTSFSTALSSNSETCKYKKDGLFSLSLFFFLYLILPHLFSLSR